MATKTGNDKDSVKKKGFDFEKSLEKLRTIQEDLEIGNLTLEKSIEQFEKGTVLIKECRKALEEAEQRVKILSKDDGTTIPFDKD